MSAEDSFRPATLDDAAALATLHAEAFGASGWPANQLASLLSQPFCRAFAVMRAGNIIGFILCQQTADEWEILTFAVTPAARRQGIGLKLVRLVHRLAQGTGARKIFLEVAADNDAARYLYEKEGYDCVGTRKNYYRRGDAFVDALQMARICGAD